MVRQACLGSPRELWLRAVGDGHCLRIYMGQPRHKLEADRARPHYLLTALGVGYRLSLVEPVMDDCPEVRCSGNPMNLF